MKKYTEYILSLPKTIYFNLKYFDLKTAIKLPIFVSYKTKFKELNGDIIIDSNLSIGMIKIGFGSVGIFDKSKRRTTIQISGKVKFYGNASIGHGCGLSIRGNLEIGNNFIMTAESKIICHDNISFGENCLISWDCLFMDTDSHYIYDYNNKCINKNKPIIVGDNVWIGCRNLILKGTYIGDNIVIGAQSKLSGEFREENTIISGNPAKVVKKDIVWSK